MHWIILDSYICVELYNIANSETNAGNLNDRAGKGSTELGYSWLFHVSGFLVILCLEEVRKLGWMYWSQTQHGSCSGDVEIVQVFHRIHPFISQNTTKQHKTRENSRRQLENINRTTHQFVPFTEPHFERFKMIARIAQLQRGPSCGTEGTACPVQGVGHANLLAHVAR